MSLLAPLYAMGLLAISLPVLFHFIRRTPRGDFDFSTLMFLSPSPPRLTRRSRIDNLLLLLLRGLVLALLALAFARPFLDETLPIAPADADQRRIAIVVDTSASMRRADLWRQARATVGRVLDDARPTDEVAVYFCDQSLRPLASFEDLSQLEPAERLSFIQRRLADAEPTWAATHLGQGLIDAAEIVNNTRDEAESSGQAKKQIVLVSDLQEGSRLDALANYEWPADVELVLKTLRPSDESNASLHRLADSSEADEGRSRAEVRVRVANEEDSTVEQFRLQWLSAQGQAIGEPIETVVPAGESRVVRVARHHPQVGAERLQLIGDAHDFDGILYFADRALSKAKVVYIGSDDADDPRGMSYYLKRALGENQPSALHFAAYRPSDDLMLSAGEGLPLVVVTVDPSAEQTDELRKYLDDGGTVLFVVAQAEPAGALATLLGVAPFPVQEAAVDDYTMLGEIAFDHPLFAPMAAPQFNDFTQIRYWKYRQLDDTALADATVLARFENGDLALIERRIKKGKLYVLTSGWQPSDSQLARSWKFVLLASTLADAGADRDQVYFHVNEPVPLGGRDMVAEAAVITKPNGVRIEAARDATVFDGTDMPGIYSIAAANGSKLFAVNLDPSESRTTPLAIETLEQMGCRLVDRDGVANNDAAERRAHDAVLEGRQKFWQWLIAAALALLVLETWLAGRLSQPARMEGVMA